MLENYQKICDNIHERFCSFKFISIVNLCVCMGRPVQFRGASTPFVWMDGSFCISLIVIIECMFVFVNIFTNVCLVFYPSKLFFLWNKKLPLYIFRTSAVYGLKIFTFQKPSWKIFYRCYFSFEIPVLF